MNGLNQYTAAGPPADPTQGAVFAYDPNGNLTSDGSRTFAYDVENRLISASPNVTLSYDPLGRLFQVTGGAGTTQFLYDGDALVAEYDPGSGSGAGGTLLRRYVHNTVGADVPLLWYEGADLADRRFLYADHQGSIPTAT